MYFRRCFFTVIVAMLVVSAVSAAKTDSLVYYDASSLPLMGTLAPDATKAYSRLPDSLKGKVRDELWALGLNSAGLSVRFRSDASTLALRWKALNKFNMNHMTATGIRGLDLYVLDGDSAWTTVSSARPLFNSHQSISLVATDMLPEMREYMIYLPLYDGVDSIYIGVDSAARVLPPSVDLPVRRRPLVMYGTSILQGGCASRPGMAHTNILQSRLNREVINLGFSGNARLDPEIAHLMASCDASVFVIDALPNCTADLVSERMADFIGIIRAAHPDTPILLVESPLFPIGRFNQEVSSTIAAKNNVLRDIYLHLSAADANLHYFKGEDVLGECVEGTVDNYHLTDLGFTKFADALQPVIENLMK